MLGMLEDDVDFENLVDDDDDAEDDDDVDDDDDDDVERVEDIASSPKREEEEEEDATDLEDEILTLEADVEAGGQQSQQAANQNGAGTLN